MKIKKNKWKIIKLIFVIILSTAFYVVLYFNLTTNLTVPPIEVKNECDEEIISCERQFAVNTYFDKIKEQFEKIPKNTTIVEKLAGASPELFKYKISFKDQTSNTGWEGQTSHSLGNNIKICSFKNEVKIKGSSGTFKESISLEEIPMRLKDVATSFNDCIQSLPNIPPEIDSIERIEKYSISVKPNFISHITLATLAILLTTLAITTIKIIIKFIIKDLTD